MQFAACGGRTPASERTARPRSPADTNRSQLKYMPASRTISDELRKLVRQSSHYLAALVASLGLGFISFPIFTRVFSVADYGLIDFTQKILLLFTAASKMGLQNSALRFYNGQMFSADAQSARRYYSTMFFGVAVAAAGVGLLFVGAVKSSPVWLIDAPIAALLCFASALIFLRAMESLLLSFLRIEERSKAYGATTVGIRAGTIAAVCLLLPLAGRSARTYLSGLMVVEIAAVVILSVLLVHRGLLGPGKFDFSLFRAAVAFGFSLIVSEVASIILDSGDRVLVRHYLGGAALGYYTVAYGLSVYVNDLLIAPLNLALLPIYLRLWTSEGREKTIEFLSVAFDLFLMAAAGVFAVTTVSQLLWFCSLLQSMAVPTS